MLYALYVLQLCTLYFDNLRLICFDTAKAYISNCNRPYRTHSLERKFLKSYNRNLFSFVFYLYITYSCFNIEYMYCNKLDMWALNVSIYCKHGCHKINKHLLLKCISINELRCWLVLPAGSIVRFPLVLWYCVVVGTSFDLLYSSPLYYSVM